MTPPRLAWRSPLLLAARLYSEPGVRALHHALKAGSRTAAQQMARDMAPFIAADAVLVPMPGRTGRGGAGLALAHELSARTGRPVLEALQGRARESIYEAKKRGVDPKTIDLGLRWYGRKPSGTILIVDNVVGTGHTARSALRAAPGAVVFVHAIDVQRFRR